MTVLDGIIGSDNPFPSILLVEGTTPATPPTGRQRLFVDTADGLLKLVDDAGVVTSIGGSAAAHIADTSAAHAAGSIGFTPASGIAATDVQAAIVEDAGDLAAHLADTTAAHAGSAISFSPTGTIAATDVQAAIAEVAAEAAGGSAPVVTESFPSGNTTMTNANQLYDGHSVTPAAGTYLFIAKIICTNASSLSDSLSAVLIVGSTIIDDAFMDLAAVSGGGQQQTHHLIGKATVSGSDAVKVQAAGGRAGWTIVRDARTNGGAVHKSTRIDYFPCS